MSSAGNTACRAGHCIPRPLARHSVGPETAAGPGRDSSGPVRHEIHRRGRCSGWVRSQVVLTETEAVLLPLLNRLVAARRWRRDTDRTPRCGRGAAGLGLKVESAWPAKVIDCTGAVDCHSLAHAPPRDRDTPHRKCQTQPPAPLNRAVTGGFVADRPYRPCGVALDTAVTPLVEVGPRSQPPRTSCRHSGLMKAECRESTSLSLEEHRGRTIIGCAPFPGAIQ